MFFKCFLCFVLGKSKCAGTTCCLEWLGFFFVCLKYNANGPNLKKKSGALPHPNSVQDSVSGRVLWERLPVTGVTQCGSIPFAFSRRPCWHLQQLLPDTQIFLCGDSLGRLGWLKMSCFFPSCAIGHSRVDIAGLFFTFSIGSLCCQCSIALRLL